MTRPHRPKPSALPIDLPDRFPASRYPLVRAIWPAVEAGALYAGIVPFRNPDGTTARLVLLHPETSDRLERRRRDGPPDGDAA